MQLDTILYAITTVSRRVEDSTYYIPGGKRNRIGFLARLRTYARMGDAANFTLCAQNCLRNDPDVATDVLGSLFTELGLSEDATWEEFAIAFL